MCVRVVCFSSTNKQHQRQQLIFLHCHFLLFIRSYLSRPMINAQNECVLFPVPQIVSTSIGAICTALLMVDYRSVHLRKGFAHPFSLARHPSMLFEYACSPNSNHWPKATAMFFATDWMITFVRVSMDRRLKHGMTWCLCSWLICSVFRYNRSIPGKYSGTLDALLTVKTDWMSFNDR